MIELSRVEARRALLAAQGLVDDQPVSAGAADILAAIRRMHALQIDTINVVARSPYLVLWSRLGDYDPSLLDGLLEQHRVFEHWSHAACFLTIEDYPLYRRVMLDRAAMGDSWRDGWLDANRALADTVLQRVRDTGPVRSADFQRTDGRRGGGWWDWKDEKVALDVLFTHGELMIAARRNFQRVYELRERILPEWDDSLAPSTEVARRELILRAVRSLGVATPAWVKTYLQDVKTLSVSIVRRELAALADEGALQPVAVEGRPAPAFVHRDNLDLIERTREPQRTTLLSPFDPVVWDRQRALDLFGFDYRIESYTPAPKRKYGYFTLPILHGDALAGRLDAKAHRREGRFEVKAAHLEPGIEVSEGLVAGLSDALLRLAAWHKTPDVVVRQAAPAPLQDALAAALT